MTYLVGDEYEEALECFDRSIEKNPHNAYVWVNRGFALDELKRYNEAVRSFDQAIRLYKNSRAICLHGTDDNIVLADMWYKKGLSLVNMDEYEKAVECFDKAIEMDDDFADAWHNKGLSFGNMEKYEKAVECFRQSYRDESKLC